MRLAGKKIGAITAGALCALLLFLPVTGQAAEAVPVRGGEHPGFSRVVFDWPAQVGYKVQQTGNRVDVTFDRAGDFNLTPFNSMGVSRLKSPMVGPDGKSLSFSLPDDVTLRHYRSKGQVVVDVVAKKTDVTPTPAARAKTGGSSEPSTKAAPAEAAKSNLRYSGTPLIVQAEPIFNALRLTYALREEVPAAVFTRADQLWVMFEGYRPVEMAALAGSSSGRIRAGEQIAHPLATILRYQLGAGQGATAHRRGNNWIVEVKDHAAAPQIPIVIGKQKTDKDLRVFMPVMDVGARIDLNDPVVGDQIHVLPVSDPGRGVVGERVYTQFKILPTVQGIAIEPRSDGLEVGRYRNGVSISAAGGLAVSLAGASEILREPSNAGADQPQRMVDLAGWRRGGPGSEQAMRLAFLQRLSRATGPEKNSVRWDMARFYLGYDQPERAIGILDVMAASDKGLFDNPDFRMVRGIANLKLRRYEAGQTDLSFKDLDNEGDAYLWRAMAANGVADYTKALEYFKRGKDQLPHYEDVERARLTLAALHAADKLGDGKFLADEVRTLESLNLPQTVKDQAEFYRGRALSWNGDGDGAKAVYKKSITSGQREISARASFAMIEQELAEKAIGPKDAIDRLERLRFRWRGDELELDVLERLGELYIATDDYRMGIRALRQAVTHFETGPRTRAISEKMSKAFQELFTGGRVDSMPPVDALALYYDFRELTPLGAEGDNMIRRLADRLVAVDLLDRAAELLEHQIRYRLEGVAQATVATRLAMIYLLNHVPDKALGVIRATRQTTLPADIETQRRHLEVRALIDLKHYEEAEVLLERDKSRAADMLRADIYWGGARWADVVRNGEALLGRRWAQQAPLTNDERRQILRVAVALSLDENMDGLRVLRSRYNDRMVDGAYGGAFDVITAKQEPSSSEIKALTESISSVNTFESFMEAYRKEFERKGV